MQVAAVEDKTADALRMEHRIGDRHKAALTQSNERKPTQVEGVDDRFEIGHPGFEREIAHVPVRQA